MKCLKSMVNIGWMSSLTLEVFILLLYKSSGPNLITDHPEPHSPVPSLVSSPSPPPVNKHMTGNNKRRRGNLPKAVTAILRDWLCKHKKHPYPTEEEKAQLAAETNLNLNQISNWFINARRRILQPMLEEEERKRNGFYPQGNFTMFENLFPCLR